MHNVFRRENRARDGKLIIKIMTQLLMKIMPKRRLFFISIMIVWILPTALKISYSSNHQITYTFSDALENVNYDGSILSLSYIDWSNLAPDKYSGKFPPILKPIDWKSKALTAGIPMSQATTADMEKWNATYSESGASFSIRFRSPLEANIPRNYYYLVQPSGITPMQLKELVGTARYRWRYSTDSANQMVAAPEFFGDVGAIASDSSILSGYGVTFYISTVAVLKITHLTQDPTSKKWAYKDSKSIQRNLTLPDRFGKMERGYMFSVQPINRRFLFAQWPVDICQINYSVFSVLDDDSIPTFKAISGISAGCDP